MKVLHFLGIGRLPTLPLAEATGGTERTVLELARIQQRRGFQVTVASRGDAFWQGEWENVKLLRLAPFAWAKALTLGRVNGIHLPLAALIQSQRFDVVHLHEYLKTRLFTRRAIFMHFHNDPLPDCDGPELARLAPEYWSKVGASRRQIGVSEYVARRLRLTHEYAPDAAPAHVVKVSNGVHVNAMPAERRPQARKRIREKLGLGEEDVVFLFCGALRPEKGVDVLARAFLRLCDENPGVRLVIAGGGSLWVEQGWLREDPPDSWERKVATILAPAIERKQALIAGIVPPVEIMSYYAASDALVLPSMFQETFGLVILEAFSAGLPVIAFRSGGIPELLEHGVNGHLAPQGDEKALYQAMRELASDTDLRARLGGAGEKTAQKYSWETMAERVEAVYRSALDDRAPRETPVSRRGVRLQGRAP